MANRSRRPSAGSPAKLGNSILRARLFQAVLFLNIAAVLVGFWYYQDQLAATPLHLLVFVPDCPLYVLLAIPILLGFRNTAYSFLVSIGMFKYGLWTVFVLLFHWGAYSVPAALPVTVVFIIGHLGMALEGLALLPAKKAGAAVLILCIAWFLLNDVSDYFWGTVPPIPAGGMGLVAALTFAASFIIPLSFFFHSGKIRAFAPVKFGRWLFQN